MSAQSVQAYSHAATTSALQAVDVGIGCVVVRGPEQVSHGRVSTVRRRQVQRTLHGKVVRRGERRREVHGVGLCLEWRLVKQVVGVVFLRLAEHLTDVFALNICAKCKCGYGRAGWRARTRPRAVVETNGRVVCVGLLLRCRCTLVSVACSARSHLAWGEPCGTAGSTRRRCDRPPPRSYPSRVDQSSASLH